MKKTLTKSDFVNAFQSMGRGDQFSYSGREALFDYLEEIEESTGEEMELDVIALCCNYSEYDTAIEAAEEYGWEKDEESDDEENEEAANKWLQDRTTVITHPGGVIIQQF